MGLTLQQLQSMGATPGVASATPTAPTAPSATPISPPQKGHSFQELQAMGAQPGVAQGSNQSDSNNSTSQTNTYGAFFPSSPNDNPAIAGLKATANIPSSAYNFAKGIVGAASHPIKTIEGIGNAAAGGIEEGYNELTGNHANDDRTKTFDSLVGVLKDRYGSLDNLQRTATNDPFGFGTDILSLLDGGASIADSALGGAKAADAVRGAQIAAGAPVTDAAKGGLYSQALDNGISKIGSLGAKPMGAIVNGAYTAGTSILGKALGVEGGTLKEGINAAITGGDAYKSFVQGLNGNTAPDELVGQARDALGEVVAKRQSTYQDMLSNLKGDPSKYDISPIYKEADNQLSKFGVTKGTNGALDFSRSKFALDTSAQNDIQKVYDYVKSYGSQAGDRTALGVDNLKKVLGGYYSPNSDYRAFIQGMKGATRDVLSSAPGYNEGMASYADMTDQIDDIKKGLSLGDNAAVETSFKKLTGAFRQNNEFRNQLIKELDEATGGKLLPRIAGQQMSSWMPRGLIGTLEAGGGIVSAATGGTGIVPLLVTAMATSPKMVGNLIRTLRLPSEAYQRVMSVLGGINPATPLITGNALNRATGN